MSLSIQIGANFANDYSDGERGTDAVRVGSDPARCEWPRPRGAVRRAAFATFGVAAVAGLVLALETSLVLIAVGAACILAGWLYTGGPRPYGYAGYGELFVFVFFGLVAVEGTLYVANGHLVRLGLESAIPVGLLTVALLVVNNLRDIPTDSLRASERSLSCSGQQGRERSLSACVLSAFALVVVIAVTRPWALLAFVALVPAAALLKKVLSGAEGREFVAALGMTGGLQLVFSLLLAIGIAI